MRVRIQQDSPDGTTSVAVPVPEELTDEEGAQQFSKNYKYLYLEYHYVCVLPIN